MKLLLDGRLTYVPATLQFNGKRLDIERVLLDTGSGASVFSADLVSAIGIEPAGDDRIRRILGVGGSEFVYSKRIEKLTVGEMEVVDFDVQVGAMRYGFPLDGILGMDFLLSTKAVLDLGDLTLSSN